MLSFFLNREGTKEKKMNKKILKEKERNRWTIRKRETKYVNMYTIECT